MKSILVIIATLMIIQTANAQEWQYKTSIDPMTDQSQQLAWITNNDNATLAVTCSNNDKVNVYVQFGQHKYLGNKGFKIRYRIDKELAVNATAIASTEGTAAFIMDEYLPDLLGVIQSGAQLNIEVTDFRNTPHLAAFTLNGSSKALKPLLTRCEPAMAKLIEL